MKKESMDTKNFKYNQDEYQHSLTNSLEGMKLDPSNINLNPNAKTFIPKSQRMGTETSGDTKLNLNLNANEWKPNLMTSDPQFISEENLNEDNEEPEEDEFEMIMKDIINNEVLEEMDEYDESDEDRWFPNYKDCDCCKGFIYKCKGPACVHMNVCYCKMKDECDYET